jgi:hypothetical protein
MPKVTIVLRSAGAAPLVKNADEEAAQARPARPTGGCNEVREFLAMRARQRRAEARARVIRRSVLVLGAAGAATVALVRWNPTFELPAAGFQAPVTSAPLPPAALVTAVPAASFSPAPAPVANAMATAAADDAACGDDFKGRRWRAAVDSCTRAFKETPGATAALRIAHAQWSSGRVQAAGEWAARAVELGTSDADAYVLIGHARRQAGDAQDAIQAYRSYLRWAPRGWHARTVRAALRRLRPQNHDQARSPDDPVGKQATSAQRAIDRESLAGRL